MAISCKKPAEDAKLTDDERRKLLEAYSHGDLDRRQAYRAARRILNREAIIVQIIAPQKCQKPPLTGRS